MAMKKILIDSGPLIALFDASDEYHDNAMTFIKNNKLPLITTIASITETLHLLDFNQNAQTDFLEWIKDGAVEIHNIEISDFYRIKQLTEKYLDLPMDFAHASFF
jgi:predicted nucleic acid-binding protein